MKSIFRKLTLCALLGASTSAYAAEVLIPNGDFEDGATNWVQNSGAGEVTPVTFATGGNPGGYGTLTPAGGWGVLVSPDIPGAGGGGVPIADLGLTAGLTYTFTYDSINTTGAGPVGGFKVEAWADDLLVGNSGEIFPTVIGDGSTWQTYTLVWPLPATTQKLIFVPLWAGGANTDTIGFDNIGVDNDPVAPPPVIPGIPNPGFEIPGGANWAAVGFITGYSYPTTGGNPDGYGVMDATNGEWGIWVSNNNTVLTLEQLSLTVGQTYNFTMDMRLISGGSIGGFKVDFFNGGVDPFDSTDDIRIATIGDGSTWQTYTYPVTIPLGTTGVKLVPLWGPSSVVGYDNIAVDTTPIAPPPFVPDQIPNGDFEIAGGANWTEDIETGGPQISYPATEGNPSGHAVIDATLNEGFAAIEAFGGAEKTFASLGLAPGDTFIIQLDMKILEGANIGGVRLVGAAAWEAPALPDQRPAIIGDGSTWETYSFSIEVPALTAQARFTFLWGFNSKVAYDNVMIVLPGPAGPFQATIAQGTSVSWTAASETNQYQPQESDSISGPWTNLGSPIVGNTVTSVFDANTSPFYRVLESSPSVTQTVYNGNFDEEGLFPDEANGWNPVQSQLAFRLTTGGRTGVGDPCMQISVLNNTAEPNGSEIQQDTKDADALNPGAGAIVPGNTYNFSFWAKQISSGASYEQRYRIQWLDDGSNILGDEGFQNFPLTVTGNWVQLTQNGLIAPAGTTTALIQILGVTGAVSGGLGEVLIDDVSLESTGFGAPTVLTAATLPAVEISWPSTTGQNYQVQSSTNLVDWPNFGGVISGNNTTKAVYDTITPPAKFYRVGELP